MGGELITTLLIVIFGAAVATVGVIGGSIAMSKRITKRKAYTAEKRLRNELENDLVNPHRILGLVKKYYKTQIKSASPEVARKAKLNYFILQNEKAKKINKLRSFDEKETSPSNAFEYTEKIVFDPRKNLSIELPSNSIMSYSQSLVDDYKLALNPTQSESHFINRSYKGGVYPLELTITDSDGNKVAFLSDVSANRFYEFTQRIMANLYMNFINSDVKKEYKIIMTDTAVNSKFGNSQITFDVNSAADCRDKCSYLNKVMFEQYKGFNDKWLTIKFDNLLALNQHENTAKRYLSNKELTKVGLVYKESNLESKFINEILTKKSDEFSYQNNLEKHYITSLMFNGQEIISIESKNYDVSSSMRPYLAAYAFVKGYKNYNENNIRNDIQILVKEKNVETNAIYQHSVHKLGDFFDINSLYASNPNFQEAVKKITEEKNLVIEAKKLKDPEKLSKKLLSKNLEKTDYESKIITNRLNLEKLFQNEVNAQTDKGAIAYITKITNNLDEKQNINLKLETNSKTVQRNYFYQLLLEAYVIGKNEINETKKLSPITIAVNSITIGSTFEEKPKDQQQTVTKLDELKKIIVNFARVSFNKPYTLADFENEVKKVEDDYNATTASTFIF